MKRFILILAAAVFIFLVMMTLRFILGGDEDIWLCDNGIWVKHGNPAAAMPDVSCDGTGDGT
jgi:hypothetical protein